MSKHDDEYAAALSLLDRMHASGQIAGADYEVRRARLLAEAADPHPQISRGRYVARLAGIVVLLFVLLGLLAWILSLTG